MTTARSIMAEYAATLNQMMDAILSGRPDEAHAFLRDKPDFPPSAQLNIYVEGYRLRLAEAIQNTYPALHYYLGQEEFLALAHGFIGTHPSAYFNLDKYPIAFAPYVAMHHQEPFARDLATLEGTIQDVYQREETRPIDPHWAQAQTPDTLASTPLPLREAGALLAFTSDVDAYLTAFRAEGKATRGPDRDNWLLVLRHRHQVHRLPLESGEHALLSLLAEGQTLGSALEDARLEPFVVRGDFGPSLQGWLARWVSEGVLRQP